MKLLTSKKLAIASLLLAAGSASAIQATHHKPLQLMGAKLQVGHILVAPVIKGYVKPGSNLRLGFSIKNIGKRVSGRNASYQILCRSKHRKPCPIASSKRPLPMLKPGQTRNFTLISAAKAKPGKYRIYIKVTPAASRKVRFIDVKVGRSLVLNKQVKRKIFSNIITRKVAHKFNTQWVKLGCLVVPPVEFPKPKITNIDNVTMPVGAEVFYIADKTGAIRKIKLTQPLAPGQSIYGHSFEAYSKQGKPHKCHAVGRMATK